MPLIVWEYRARVYGRGHRVFAEVLKCVHPWEYALPDIRAEVERQAEAELRRLEGVEPDIPLECTGWTRRELAD